MNKLFIASFVILLSACGGPKKFLGQDEGSLYTSEILKRNPSDGKEVTLKVQIHKKLKNNFYLVKDEYGLILVKIRSSLLGLDTDYNYQTLFLMKGETDNESKHFYIEIEELELINP